MARGFRNVGSFDKEQGFHICHINCRSIRNKIDDCTIMFDSCNMDIITVSESWLEEKDISSEFAFIGFKMYRWDRSWEENGKTKVGGGLLMYVKNQYVVLEEEFLPKKSTIDIEITSLIVKRNGAKNILLLNIYRPPQGNVHTFWDEMKDIISNIPHINRYELYILGDMNINMLDETSEFVKDFKQGMMGYGLINYITCPTRYAETDTCLDLIFTNCDNVTKAGCIEFGLSDHEMVYVTTLHNEIDNSPKVDFTCRRMKNYTTDKLIQGLSGFNWNMFTNSNDVDALWCLMLKRITHVMDVLCPFVKYRVKEIKKPWVTADMISKIKEKDRALSRAKRSKDNFRIEAAKKERNKTSRDSKKKKREFVVRILEENKGDPKKFWYELKKVMPGKTSKDIINLISQETGQLLEDNEVSGMINQYFTGIGAKLASNNNSIWVADFPRVDNNIQNWNVTEEEVLGYLKDIKVHKTSAIDGLSSSVLKDAFIFLSQELTYIYKCSLETGKIPMQWKEAVIVPIPKDGNPTLVENYRPISLLPLPSKILEKIVHRNLIEYLDENNILSDKQGGYRKGCSTVNTIGKLTDDILRDRNVGKETLAVFIDLKKAFDTVHHSILLKKCDRYGIRGKPLIWLENYLSGRRQCTFANNVKSEKLDISYGVPQGSILGPLLFLLYVNEVENVLKECKVLLYADDTVIYLSGQTSKDVNRKMQSDLDRYYEWCHLNRLTLNAKKTKFMCFANTYKWKDCKLKINGEKINGVSNYKYLGVVLDDALTYEKFINGQLRTAGFRTYQMARLNAFIDKPTALLLYKTNILPILEYGDILIAGCKVDLLARIQRAQNRGIKVALRLHYRTPTYDVHALANLNMLHDRLEAHQMKEAYRRVKIEAYRDNRNLNTRAWDGPVLKCCTPNGVAYTRSLEHTISHVWNVLRPVDRNIETLEEFMSGVKIKLAIVKPKIQQRSKICS